MNEDEDVIGKPVLGEILDKAARLGASYANVRHQSHDHERITVENRTLRD